MPFELVGNPNVLAMEYAVRGPIPQRAAELRKQGRRTIPCNIGNPQALGQRPLTLCRHVLSLLEDPTRIERERALTRLLDQAAATADLEAISEHEIGLAETILAGLGGGVGAYTDSNGTAFIRAAVARFIDARDEVETTGAPHTDPDRVFLTDGASEAARHLLELLITGPDDGIMVPIPQYPLYSATITRCGGTQVGYFPDEDAGWTLGRAQLEEPLAAARARGVKVKAIVVINPGNPTGALLPEESLQEVIDFAAEHELLIIADEVYQENVYGGRFVSFARAVGSRDVPLCSLHSVSKGFYGECGHRGGYLEVRNPPRLRGHDLRLHQVMLKQASVSLCSNTIGQALTYLMVSPPSPGSASYERFRAERDHILSELHDKALLTRKAFEEMAGVLCFGRIGALYLFPRLGRLPAGTGDFDYCMALLEKTGLVTVNGSGFGQKPGTHHLRIAFLPPKDLLAEVLPAWIAFHNEYVGE
jgi:aspartate/methionine/tyrosine aminotransferase